MNLVPDGAVWSGRRWAVVVAALLLVPALLVILAVLAVSPERRADTPLPAPPPPFLPLPSAGFEPPVPVFSDPPAGPVPGSSAPAPPPERTVTATTVRPPAPPARRTTPSRPAAAPVAGRYRVVNSFADGFIGEVLIGNTTGGDRDWTVRLRFRDNVGGLRTSWVESAPQATLTTDGDEFTWTSGVPVPAGSEVALRFHFSRTGSGDQPRACTVNGTACTGTD